MFAQHNLVSDGSFNEFHVIVCRNVMIYFDRPLQDAGARAVLRQPGAFGVLGARAQGVDPVHARTRTRYEELDAAREALPEGAADARVRARRRSAASWGGLQARRRRCSTACPADFARAGRRRPAPQRRRRRERAGASCSARTPRCRSSRPRTRSRSSPAASTSRRPTTTCSSSPARFALSVDEPRAVTAGRRSTCCSSRRPTPTATRVVGVVLTGANADGARGPRADQARAAASRSCRTRTTAERPRDAARPRSPPAAADAVLPLDGDRAVLLLRASSSRRRREAARREPRRAADPARRRPAREPARARGDPRAARPASSCAPARARRRCERLLTRRLRGDPARRPDAGAGRLRDGRAIKRRERTRDIPIIFLTAISKERAPRLPRLLGGRRRLPLQAVRPDVLRSKVAVFVELYEKNRAAARAGRSSWREQELAAADARERGALPARSPRRCRRSSGRRDAGRRDRRTTTSAGTSTPGSRTADATAAGAGAPVVHPDDLPPAAARWQASLETGDRIEVGVPAAARADGAYRWHLGRVAPRCATSRRRIAAGSAPRPTSTTASAPRSASASSSRPGALLGTSLDYRRTPHGRRALAVPDVADWCGVDLVGRGRRAAPARRRARGPDARCSSSRELQRRYPPDRRRAARAAARRPHRRAGARPGDHRRDARGGRARRAAPAPAPRARPPLVHVRAARRARPHARRGHLRPGRVGPALRRGRPRLAEELARRAATAIDNARLFRARRGARPGGARARRRSATASSSIDRDGVIRLWNPAAEAITGCRTEDVSAAGSTASSRAGTRSSAADPARERPGRARAAETRAARARRAGALALDLRRRLRRGHRLRLPRPDRGARARAMQVGLRRHGLARAAHAARGDPRRRADPPPARHRARPRSCAGGSSRSIGDESSRLAEIVNDLLLASHLDSGLLQLQIESCDARELAASRARGRAEPICRRASRSSSRRRDDLPPVAADRAQLHQVLANLVDNAIKYSPDGGPVRLRRARRRQVRFSVSDRGSASRASEQRRVFEKFYRLDPNMTRGIGGTGLGLYICRELVRRIRAGSGSSPRRARGRRSPSSCRPPRCSPGRGGGRRRRRHDSTSAGNGKRGYPNDGSWSLHAEECGQPYIGSYGPVRLFGAR